MTIQIAGIQTAERYWSFKQLAQHLESKHKSAKSQYTALISFLKKKCHSQTNQGMTIKQKLQLKEKKKYPKVCVFT